MNCTNTAQLLRGLRLFRPIRRRSINVFTKQFADEFTRTQQQQQLLDNLPRCTSRFIQTHHGANSSFRRLFWTRPHFALSPFGTFQLPSSDDAHKILSAIISRFYSRVGGPNGVARVAKSPVLALLSTSNPQRRYGPLISG